MKPKTRAALMSSGPVRELGVLPAVREPMAVTLVKTPIVDPNVWGDKVVADIAEVIRQTDTDLGQTRKAEIDALVRAAFYGVQIILDPTVEPGKYRLHVSPEMYEKIRSGAQRSRSRG